MLRHYITILLLFHLWEFSTSTDVTLTFTYQQTGFLSCEIPNSDSNAVWTMDGVTLDTTAGTNLLVTNTGSLVIDKFEFADTGTYTCVGSDVDYTLIIDCPANSDPNYLSKQCICSPGATRNNTNDRLECDLCPYATYKLHPGDNDCFACPTSLITESEGSISETSCVCPPGQGTQNSLCIPCPADTYQDSYEETPCVDCPRYSATPQPLGEADAEGFTLRSDCVCLYSLDNADNNTCWPFYTTPTIHVTDVETTSVVISWGTESHARSDSGGFRGVIAGYHVEVNEDNELNSNAFTHNYSPFDYTPGEEFTVNVQNLKPDTSYTVSVNAYTSSTEYENGPPSLLTITTAALPTTTPTATTESTTPHLFVSSTPSTATTSTTTQSTDTTTLPTDTTTLPTDTTTLPTTTPIETTGSTAVINSDANTGTTVEATPKVIVTDDNTASSLLAVVVVLLAIFIAVLLILVALRYVYTRRRRSKNLRYTKRDEGRDKMKRIGAQPRYPVYSNTAYLSADASDGLI